MYEGIKAWGRLMGSSPEWINTRIIEAKKLKAPKDALFRNSAGEWVTFGNAGSVTRFRLVQYYGYEEE